MCTLTAASCSVKILNAASVSFSATLTYNGDANNAPSSRAFAMIASSPGASTSSAPVQTISTTLAPQSSGTYPTGLIVVGGLATVVAVAGAIVLRRRRKSLGA